MLKIFLIIAAVLVVAVTVVLALATTKPDTFRVTRTTTIKAPPEKIYPMIADFHRWTAWSPYENKDPAMKRTYGGTPGAVGQTYGWSGDKNTGVGSMTLTEAAPSSKVALKLDFISPFEAHNTVVFSIVPQGDGTIVNWDMQGPTPFIGKIMHVFMNMDKMVGTDFEVGLANLKAQAEK
ncbi:MAG: SRPBCC family protein [Pseudolabrys sp.]|nr:SRPBCC family protein [Pseudolabrys sp.]MDP2295634.1 SRPBCC family protein [Pseudolabrys sp.]